jgi:hypothetical protein
MGVLLALGGIVEAVVLAGGDGRLQSSRSRSKTSTAISDMRHHAGASA